MSRDEQIEAAAYKYCKDYAERSDYSMTNLHVIGIGKDFTAGAKWADENPNSDYQNRLVNESLFFSRRCKKLEQVIKLYEKIINDAREQMALMADGEGNNPQTYMDMSKYGVDQIDSALTESRKIMEGK